MHMIQKRLASILSRGWWMLLLRGLAAIAFGLLLWLRPGISLATLILLFGAYSLADGILGVLTAFGGRADKEHFWPLLLHGLLGIGVGILTFMAPGLTALALLFYIAIRAIATGLLEIVTAIRLRKEIEGEWLFVLAGAASVLFGLILVARPGTGALAVLWLIGTYALVFGVLLVILAFRVRSFPQAAARA